MRPQEVHYLNVSFSSSFKVNKKQSIRNSFRSKRFLNILQREELQSLSGLDLFRCPHNLPSGVISRGWGSQAEKMTGFIISDHFREGRFSVR